MQLLYFWLVGHQSIFARRVFFLSDWSFLDSSRFSLPRSFLQATQHSAAGATASSTGLPRS